MDFLLTDNYCIFLGSAKKYMFLTASRNICPCLEGYCRSHIINVSLSTCNFSLSWWSFHEDTEIYPLPKKFSLSLY